MNTIAPSPNWIDRWIANKAAVALALTLWLAIPLWLVFSGLSILADTLSQRIPSHWQTRLGDYAMREIKYAARLRESELPDERKMQVIAEFDRLKQSSGLPHVKLELVRGMHNAFALPGDTVVLTDELVLALDEEALMAVMAHELGHVQHKHVMRRWVSSSMLSSLLQLTAGHSSAGGKMGSFAGQALIGSAYSRQDETQADFYAVDLLKKVGVNPLAFAKAMQFFQKIEKEKAAVAGNWTSSHPGTQERIDNALKAAQPASIQLSCKHEPSKTPQWICK
jgi:predicted Zn-dependent protease